MASSFATVNDVAARWRPLTPAETTVAQALVEDASSLIRARFPGIDAQVANGAIDPGILVIVASNMVKRALVAPLDGVSQESEGTGPYSHSQTFANPMRNVFLTEADLTLIMGYRPTGVSATFSNDTRAPLPYTSVFGW